MSFQLTDPDAFNVEGVTQYSGFAGIPGPQGWDELPAGCWSYNDADKKITLDGAAIDAAYPDKSAPDELAVQIIGQDAEGNDLMMATQFVEFRYSLEHLDLSEESYVLPYWENDFNQNINLYIENSAHPDGEDFELEVSNVEVISGADLLEEFKEDSDGENRWWHFRPGKSFGEVVFRISYTNYDGSDKALDVHMHIVSDIYTVHMESEGNIHQGLPGTGIDLSAWAEHQFFVDDHEENTTEGLHLEWSIIDGSESSSLTVDKSDQTCARVEFNDLAEGEKEFWGSCVVQVAVKDNLSDDPDEIRSTDDRWFNISTDYTQIYPTMIDSNLGVGETLGNVKFEVRRYLYGGGEGYNDENYKTYAIEKARWEYDDNALTITDSRGNDVGHNDVVGDTFSFSRKAEWDFDTRIEAFYLNDEKEYESIDCNYWFDRLDYDIWFDEHDVNVYDDSSWSFDLMTRDDLDYSNVDFRFNARGRIWSEDNDDDVLVPDDCWSVDGKTVTIYGPKAAAAGLNEIWIEAEAFIGNRSLGKWADCRLEIREACKTHFWLNGPEEFSDDEPVGHKRQMCWYCGEKRIIELEKKSIEKATVSGISDKVYTGKAITQNPKVVVDGKTLVKDTDYTVKYSKNKDVGTATVTITGKLAYTGTVKKTFTIIPKPTSISKVTAAKKGFTVTWKKQATQTTGYEVMYALNTKFTSGKKTVNIAKNSTVSKKVTGLKAKKKYYVRIRTYKTVSGKTIYSDWSPVKTVTTKK